MRAGAMSIPHGHQGANVNVLTCKDQIDLPTGMGAVLGHSREPPPGVERFVVREDAEHDLPNARLGGYRRRRCSWADPKKWLQSSS
jgi:hypothetical protein